MCKYTNYQKLCDLLFACFALTWVVTRLGVYPTWILYSTTIEAPQIVEMFPAYYIFNGLLAILLVLHVIWTYFILKIIYKAMYSGKVSFQPLHHPSIFWVGSGEKIDLWSKFEHSISKTVGCPHFCGVNISNRGSPFYSSLFVCLFILLLSKAHLDFLKDSNT